MGLEICTPKKKQLGLFRYLLVKAQDSAQDIQDHIDLLEIGTQIAQLFHKGKGLLNLQNSLLQGSGGMSFVILYGKINSIFEQKVKLQNVWANKSTKKFAVTLIKSLSRVAQLTNTISQCFIYLATYGWIFVAPALFSQVTLLSAATLMASSGVFAIISSLKALNIVSRKYIEGADLKDQPKTQFYHKLKAIANIALFAIGAFSVLAAYGTVIAPIIFNGLTVIAITSFIAASRMQYTGSAYIANQGEGINL